MFGGRYQGTFSLVESVIDDTGGQIERALGDMRQELKVAERQSEDHPLESDLLSDLQVQAMEDVAESLNIALLAVQEAMRVVQNLYYYF